jgi:phosphonatase-like hydrolase
MDQFDLIVFDIAGTTVQATDQVTSAFRAAFLEVDVALTDDQIQSVRGRSKREAIIRLLSEHSDPGSDAHEHVDRVNAAFENSLKTLFQREKAKPIPGAEETFEWLHNRGVKVALSTGFGRAVTDLIMTALDWHGVVDAVVCSDNVPRGRPAPYLIFRAMENTAVLSVHRVAAVGDTVADIQAAQNAGVRWSIGVLSGAHSERQLRACAPSAIIDSVRDLPGLFEVE